MRTSKAGIELIKQFESCHFKAYRLSGEQFFTIGYGHSYDPEIDANTIWNQSQADQALKKDLAKFEKYVETTVKHISLNQNQFDALVSYTYNRGLGGLKQLETNSKTVAEYSKNIVKFWGSAVKYKKGLVRRRKAEQELFDRPLKEGLKPGLSVNEVAIQVIDGKWGTGVTRKNLLVQYGYNPTLIQEEVNRILKG